MGRPPRPPQLSCMGPTPSLARKGHEKHLPSGSMSLGIESKAGSRRGLCGKDDEGSRRATWAAFHVLFPQPTFTPSRLACSVELV